MNKVVIFDMDGVLVDSTEIAYELLLDVYPAMTRGEFLELSTGNFHEQIAQYKLNNAPLPPRTDEQIAARRAYYAKRKAESPIFPGVVELLHFLHDQGYVLVVNTSAFEKNCLPILQAAGMDHLFDMIATAEVAKTKVEKFALIQEKYSVLNKDLIFITDTLGDIREADTAGVPTIAVSWGSHDHTYFNREPHANLLKIVDSMDELKESIIAL